MKRLQAVRYCVGRRHCLSDSTRPTVHAHWLGEDVDYNRAFALQRQCQSTLLRARENGEIAIHRLLLLSHAPVYTIGIRTKGYPIEEEERLRNVTNAQFVRSDRGGLITYHGPGQLTAYPLLDLRLFGDMSVRNYVRSIERCIMHVLAIEYGLLDASTTENPGVWLPPQGMLTARKIAAIGTRVRKWCTMHGLAVNCDERVMPYFDHIVACGLEGLAVTCIEREIKHPQGDNATRSIATNSVQHCAKSFVHSFAQVFNCNVVYHEDHDCDTLERLLSTQA